MLDNERHRIWGAIGTAALVGLGQTAAAETDLKFTPDGKYQGPTAARIVAEEESLDVSIDAGNGPTGAATRVARGAYQMGFADSQLAGRVQR